ncbi:hypothetical protein D3C86_1373560 [compost metagenome]
MPTLNSPCILRGSDSAQGSAGARLDVSAVRSPIQRAICSSVDRPCGAALWTVVLGEASLVEPASVAADAVSTASLPRGAVVTTPSGSMFASIIAAAVSSIIMRPYSRSSLP